MRRTRSILGLAIFCLFGAAAAGFAQAPPLATADASRPRTESRAAEPSSVVPWDPDIPKDLQDVMNRAQARYLEGSNLLKNGESARAREAFNAAVDQILEAGWDLTSTTVLNQFFQDLIRRIQTDESRFLGVPEPAEERPEAAVVDELDKLELIPIEIEPSLKEVIQTDIANTRYDIPVKLNERVFQSLNFWITKGRKVFTEGLMRSGRYREMIERVFQEEAIPLDIMYLAQVESLFKTNALSRARAKGIWQFGRGTAIRYGLKVNGHIDERSDPEKSTRAAARYLKDLFGMFKDWNLVLAAYNWGEGKVLKLINRSGINDFWGLTELRRNFPKETKNHVPLIMASIIIARNPEHYGFPTLLDPPARFDRVPVSKPIDLRAAARLLNVEFDELKSLNPALRTTATPPAYPGFELRIPAGIEPEAVMKLATLPEVRVRPQAEFSSRHRVLKGETLSSIARRYGVSVAALQEVNNIASVRALRAGTWLTVPSSGSRGRLAARRSSSKRLSSKVGSSIRKPATPTAKAAPRIPTSPRLRASPPTARKAGSGSAPATGKKPSKTVASR
jgi:membrane-bound lytic murein transglycosylase D